MQYELCDLMDKYGIMAKWVEASSLVDQMLTNTNLPFNAEVMAMPLPSKFRVPHKDL